jgi:hypothetical protein
MVWNEMEIPIVSGLNDVGSPLINGGEGNFIQVYFNNVPYFRAGEEKHYKLLENFLKEVNINDFEKDKKSHGFHNFFIPIKKGKLYELVGAGVIEEATIIKENINELSGKGHIAIGGYSTDYDLYPSIKHISKILKHFKEPLIFVGSEYLTEEERGFVESPENYEEEGLSGFEDISR